jgi:5-oxoprolinase (ATP-hydrolysing)
MKASALWQFWIDRGGTFTDVVARSPGGAVHTAKLLSEDPTRHEDAAIAAIRQLTGCLFPVSTNGTDLRL